MRQLSHTEDRTLDIEQHAYNLLSQRVDLLAVLQEVDVELNHTLELNSVVRMAISAAQVLSQASSGCIILIEGGALMVFAAFGGYTGVSSLPADGIIMRALRLERSEYLLDVTQDDDYCPTIPETRAQIAIPMLAHHRIVGLLNVETETPEYFTPEVFEAIVLLASRIASAVENARLYRTSQEQLAELHKLYADLTGLEQLKSNLIRITAHDLRSPLSIIYGYTDLLQNELHDHLTEQQIEYFQKVRQAMGASSACPPISSRLNGCKRIRRSRRRLCRSGDCCKRSWTNSLRKAASAISRSRLCWLTRQSMSPGIKRS